MENEEKKGSNPAIDENYLMSMMAGAGKPSSQQPETDVAKVDTQPGKSTQRGRPRKASEAEYEKLFFSNADTTARNGKSVYIRPEFHERLSRIVHVIGEDKLTIYAYLDNVLEHHFQEFGEQITASFNNKYKPIL